MVSISGVTKEYKLGKSRVQALAGIDLEVGQGEFVSVSGPSGSGKSTLLNLIGCIDSPTSGRVEVLGRDVSAMSDKALSGFRNSTIGFVFQSFNLIPVLSAFENVEYPLVILGLPKRERKAKALAILNEVGLADYAGQRPDELSGGQRQRVAIARALVTNPKIVLADEPTANLDSKTAIDILELMKGMNERHKTTFIFSTHDARITGFAGRRYAISDGKIAAA